MARVARRTNSTGIRAAYLGFLSYYHQFFPTDHGASLIAQVKRGETLHVPATDMWRALYGAGHPAADEWLRWSREGWSCLLEDDEVTLVGPIEGASVVSGGRNQQRDAINERWYRR